MHYRMLGFLEAETGDGPVDLGPPKQRTLLAVLLTHPNQLVSTGRLIELLWGDEPPRTASHSVQVYVSALRKSLADGEKVIETRAPGYLLRVDPSDIDAGRFTQLVEEGGDRIRLALDLWQGSPLADFTYEQWAQPHIRRLESLHARAVEMLAAAELEDGRPAEVPALVGVLIEKEPLREEPRRLLMLALYRTGRQAEALRVYRDFRKVLGDEMGVDPSADLAQLEEQILLQDPLLAPRSRSSAVGEARNPYKGLGAFDEIDAGDFFGRDKLVAQMAGALAAGDRLLVVVGPSGSGKSSVVRAGLVPALREGAVPGSDRWVLTTMVPGRHPFEQLEAALQRVSRSEVPAVLEQLNESETGLLRVALRILPDEKSELLLVVDQFEELFSLVPERTRRRFLDNLVTAVTDPRSRFRVVLTLRADFYDRPLLSSRFAPVFASSVVNVVPLTPAELEAAVVEPAEGVGVRVEPALLAQLITDMGEEVAALPLLQYTLNELFNVRVGQALRLDGYTRLGGLHGALTARANQLFERFDAGAQEVAKRLLLHLVGLERGSDATRRRVTLDELRGLGEIDEVLGSFISHRLLTADRDPLSGRATIQVTHEALLDGWARLRDWIEAHSIDLQRRSTLAS
ncbi:MAG TPA: BTAD domain-containing putative transcriptional regulator, partial [Acidimicrobiia bacterium]|nr:BTAD domain-containing putative transcriptional regulator [Acidimicrobiia bacterium]